LWTSRIPTRKGLLRNAWQLKKTSPEQKVRAHGETPRLCYATSNRCIGDSTAPNDGSRRENPVELTGARDSNLQTLKELLLQAKARHIASQKPKDPERLRLRRHNGSLKNSFPLGNRAGDNSTSSYTSITDSILLKQKLLKFSNDGY